MTSPHGRRPGADAANADALRLHERLRFAKVAHFRKVRFEFDPCLVLKVRQRFLGDDRRA